MMMSEGSYDLTSLSMDTIEAFEPTELLDCCKDVFTQANTLQQQYTEKMKTSSEEKARLTKNLKTAVTKLKELKMNNETLSATLAEKDYELNKLQSAHSSTSHSSSTLSTDLSPPDVNLKTEEERVQALETELEKMRTESTRLMTEKEHTGDKMKQLIEKVKFKLKKQEDEFAIIQTQLLETHKA